jgi:hypothetical protein
MKKVTKLKNRYTGEVVHCFDLKDTVVNGIITFIKVFDPANPNRVYLANKEAFDIITK